MLSLHTFFAPLTSFSRSLVETIYPSTCQCCDRRIESERLCGACRRELIEPLQKYSGQCKICHELAIEGCELCPACLLYPEAYRRVRSFWLYHGAAAQLIKKMKYHERTEIIPTLVSRLQSYLNDKAWWELDDQIWPPWDMVLGLPSTRLKDFRRGYRHTAFLARQIANQLGTPYSYVGLKRSGIKPPQVSVKLERRRENVAGSFIASVAAVESRRILLVDDVCTSGSSIAECATALKQAGASSVDVITISRSNSFLRNRLKTNGALRLSNISSLC